MMDPKDRSKIEKMIWEINTMRTYHELWTSLSPRQVSEIVGHMQSVAEYLDEDFVKLWPMEKDVKESMMKFLSFMRWIKNNSYHADGE